MHSLEQLKNALPEPAKDIKLNLSSLANETALSESQRAGTFIVSAIAARSAAAIMAMNNIYYRFTHLSKNPDFLSMPARLRMNVIANPGVEKLDFELWSLAVSAVNGCGRCIEAHEDVLLKAGMSKEAIQDAIRIAAIVFSVSVTLEDPLIADAALKAAA